MAWTVYYLHCEISQKGYVGITSRSLKQRLDEHAHPSGRTYANGRETAIASAMRRYGNSSWSHRRLALSEDTQEAAYLERYYIERLQTYGSARGPRGYNMTMGGDLPEMPVSYYEEYRRRCAIVRQIRALANRAGIQTNTDNLDLFVVLRLLDVEAITGPEYEPERELLDLCYDYYPDLFARPSMARAVREPLSPLGDSREVAQVSAERTVILKEAPPVMEGNVSHSPCIRLVESGSALDPSFQRFVPKKHEVAVFSTYLNFLRWRRQNEDRLQAHSCLIDAATGKIYTRYEMKR